MKTTLRVTFYKFSLRESAEGRTINMLKNAYWNSGKEPEDWQNFDGEMEVEGQQPTAIAQR